MGMLGPFQTVLNGSPLRHGDNACGQIVPHLAEVTVDGSRRLAHGLIDRVQRRLMRRLDQTQDPGVFLGPKLLEQVGVKA